MLARTKIEAGVAAVVALALLPASASAGLTAGPLEYERVEQTAGPGSGGTPTAPCSAPQRVTGGGGSIEASGTIGGEEGSALVSAAPYDDGDLDPYADDGFRAVGLNGTGDYRPVSVTAICLAEGSSLAYVKNAINTSSTEFSQGVACPTGHVVGGGAFVGPPHYHDAAIVSTVPSDDAADANSLADDGWFYRTTRENSASIDAAVHAICLPQGERDLRYRSKTTTVGQTAKAGGPAAGRAKVKCPKGFHASGGGVSGDLLVRASEPYDGADKGLAPDDGWKARFYAPGGAEEAVDVRVVCLR
jgi:hypothetical protein